MIKQVPIYAKFLMNLCIVKRRIKLSKKAFLSEQVSVIIKNKALKLDYGQRRQCR